MRDMRPKSVHHTVLCTFKGTMDLKYIRPGLRVRRKDKGVPVDAVKACWWSVAIARIFLNLGTGWNMVVGFTPRPPYPQEGKSVREAG